MNITKIPVYIFKFLATKLFKYKLDVFKEKEFMGIILASNDHFLWQAERFIKMLEDGELKETPVEEGTTVYNIKFD